MASTRAFFLFECMLFTWKIYTAKAHLACLILSYFMQKGAVKVAILAYHFVHYSLHTMAGLAYYHSGNEVLMNSLPLPLLDVRRNPECFLSFVWIAQPLNPHPLLDQYPLLVR